MGKQNGRKQNFKNIRLLISVFIFFFCLFFLYAETDDNIEISFSSSPLFIDSVFEVKIKLDEASPLYYYKSSNFPKLIILDKEDVIEFLDSSISSLYEGILITNKYKLKKIGRFELSPYLSSRNHQIKLKSFFIQVEPPTLSADTVFKWKILDADMFSSVNTVKQGKKYLIVLMGFFYDYVQSSGKQSGLDIHCQAPENSILEKIYDIEIKKSFIAEAGWQPTAYFFWTPLKSGDAALPIAQINIASITNTSRKIYVEGQRVSVQKGENEKPHKNEEEKEAIETLQNALNPQKNSNSQNSFVNSTEIFEIKIKKALKIAELRSKESMSIFSGQIKKERMHYEKDLGLKNTFPVYSSVFQKTLWILFFIFFIVTIWFIIFCKKKNIKLTIFLIGSFIIVSVLVLLFGFGKYQKAIYLPRNYEESSVVYNVPEKSGTIISSLQIGETVIIKQKTAEWVFIEKKDGTGGWQKKSEFIVSD